MFDYTNAKVRAAHKTFDLGLRTFLLKVYYYVAMGLLVTGVAAVATLSFPPLSMLMFNIGPNGEFFGVTTLGMILTFAPLFIGIYFFSGFGSMDLERSKKLFWAFAALTGMSLANLGLMYTGVSIARTFFICSIAFTGMSIYGYVTKGDLTSMTSFLRMGVIGLIIATLINIIFMSPAIYFVTSLLGVIIFMGLIAWDTQKLKSIYYSVGDGELAQKFAILGAFQLYLDFINLFLYLLRFFGQRRNN